MGQLDELWTDAPEGTSAASASPPSSVDVSDVRLKYLIDNTPAIIYSSVPSGDFKWTWVSANAWHQLGYPPDAIVADPNFWFDHIHPDDLPTIFSSIALLFVEGQRSYEYRFRAADGRYVWMHDTLRLVRDSDDTPIEIVGSLTDISDRKAMEEALRRQGEEQRALIERLQQAQEQLVQSEKLASIGQLAAGIAHEINNPIGFVNSNMSSLRGYVTTLLDLIDNVEQAVVEGKGDDAVAARIERMKAQADLAFLRGDVVDLVNESLDGLERVREIVQSLKDFSRIGSNQWAEADLHVGLDSTLHIVNNEIKYKAAVTKHYGTLPVVTCIASQLNQVFMNLLVNAAQAIAERGVIEIRTGVAEGGDWVWVAVTDDGGGIAPDHLARIFEPFFTTKPVGSGTGLGLSLSYGIVGRHGGRIEVASELGRGTTFTVHLPVRPPASVVDAAA